MFKLSICQKRSSLCYHHCGVQRSPSNTQRVAPSQKRAAAKTTCTTAWIKHQSLPRFRLYNLPPAGRASWLLFVRLVFSLTSSLRVQEGSGREKMIPSAVEAVPVGGKPPTAVGVRISTGERHGFGAAAPSSTRASSLEQRRVGGPVESSPKLVRQIGSVLTCTEELSPLIPRSAPTSSIRLRVLMSVGTSASVTRRGCRASSCSRLAERCLVSLIFSVSSYGSSFDSAVCRVFLRIVGRSPPTWADQAQIQIGNGVIFLRDSLAPVPWHFRVNLGTEDTLVVRWCFPCTSLGKMTFQGHPSERGTSEVLTRYYSVLGAEVYPKMPRNWSKAFPESNGPVLQPEFGPAQPMLAD